MDGTWDLGLGRDGRNGVNVNFEEKGWQEWEMEELGVKRRDRQWADLEDIKNRADPCEAHRPSHVHAAAQFPTTLCGTQPSRASGLGGWGGGLSYLPCILLS